MSETNITMTETDEIEKSFNYSNDNFEFKMELHSNYFVVNAIEKNVFDEWAICVYDDDKSAITFNSKAINIDNISIKSIFNFISGNGGAKVIFPKEVDDMQNLQISIEVENDIEELCIKFQIELRKINVEILTRNKHQIDFLMKENEELRKRNVELDLLAKENEELRKRNVKLDFLEKKNKELCRTIYYTKTPYIDYFGKYYVHDYSSNF